jgi:HSP20 family protein
MDVFNSLRTEMDHLFNTFAGGFGLTPFPSFGVDNAPGPRSFAIDITEDDTAFKVSAELPGMTDKDVQISLSGDLLKIRGEKHQERDATEKNMHLSERSYGAFQRSFMLPGDIDRDEISAAFSNGVLTVTLPKTAAAKPREIGIKTAA